MKKYTYLILLLLTCLAGMPMALHKMYEKENTPVAVSSGSVRDIEAVKQPEADALKTIESDKVANVPETEDFNAEVQETEKADAATVEVSGTEETVLPEEGMGEFINVDRSYFTDALFIGDSRTMGLAEYADLGSADIFAGSGMSVFKLFETKNAVAGQQAYLKDMLAAKSYGKIYFMMGINDLGYDPGRLSEQYRTVIAQIKEMQPNAILFLEANMHVTAQKSSGDAIFNNEHINSLNAQIEELSKETGSIYLDINTKFDDASGALSQDLTHDKVHVLGKHYQEWADWICTKGVA